MRLIEFAAAPCHTLGGRSCEEKLEVGSREDDGADIPAQHDRITLRSAALRLHQQPPNVGKLRDLREIGCDCRVVGVPRDVAAVNSEEWAFGCQAGGRV